MAANIARCGVILSSLSDEVQSQPDQRREQSPDDVDATGPLLQFGKAERKLSWQKFVIDNV